MAFCPSRKGDGSHCPCFDITVGQTDCAILSDQIPLYEVMLSISLIVHIGTFLLCCVLLTLSFIDAKRNQRFPLNLKTVTIILILIGCLFRIIYWSFDPRVYTGDSNRIIADMIFAVPAVLWMCSFFTMVVLWLNAVSSVDFLKGRVRSLRFVLFGVNTLIILFVVPVQIWGSLAKNSVSLWIFGIGVAIGIIMCIVISAYYAVKLRKVIGESIYGNSSSGFVQYVRKVTKRIFIVNIVMISLIFLTIVAVMFTLPIPAMVIQIILSIVEGCAVCTTLSIISVKLNATSKTSTSSSANKHSVDSNGNSVKVTSGNATISIPINEQNNQKVEVQKENESMNEQNNEQNNQKVEKSNESTVTIPMNEQNEQKNEKLIESEKPENETEHKKEAKEILE